MLESTTFKRLPSRFRTKLVNRNKFCTPCDDTSSLMLDFIEFCLLVLGTIIPYGICILDNIGRINDVYMISSDLRSN